MRKLSCHIDLHADLLAVLLITVTLTFDLRVNACRAQVVFSVLTNIPAHEVREDTGWH